MVFDEKVIAGRICNKFKVNCALCDKCMKLGIRVDGSTTKKLRHSATRKRPCNGRHLCFVLLFCLFVFVFQNDGIFLNSGKLNIDLQIAYVFFSRIVSCFR